MITGFDLQTATLSENEERVATLIARYLNEHCVGKDNQIDSIQLQHMVPTKINGSRIRKIINYLRRTKKVNNLIANNRGYYISNDAKQIAAYKKSLFQRANAILDVMHSFD